MCHGEEPMYCYPGSHYKQEVRYTIRASEEKSASNITVWKGIGSR